MKAYNAKYGNADETPRNRTATPDLDKAIDDLETFEP